MQVLFIILSFVLHFISLLWILILTIKLSRAKEMEEDYNRITNEVEDILSSFLLEMKESNEKLFNSMKKEGRSQNKMDKFNKDRDEINTETGPNLDVSNTIKVNRSKNNINSQNESRPNKTEKETLQQQVFQLDKTGLSVSEIAQKLNKGKAEIELLLKFRQ